MYCWRWLAPVLALGLLGATPATTEDIVGDGPDFRVDLTAAHLCFVQPLELRRSDACEGLAPDKIPVPPPVDGSQTLAMAVTRSGGHVLLVFVVRAPHAVEFGDSELIQQTDKAGDALLAAAPPETVIDEKHGTLVSTDAYHGFRTRFDISGTMPAIAAVGHHAMLLVYTEEASYSVVVTGPREQSQQIEATLDSIAPTITVAHPRSMHDLTYRWTRLLYGAIGIGVCAGVVIREMRKRRRRSADDANPSD